MAAMDSSSTGRNGDWVQPPFHSLGKNEGSRAGFAAPAAKQRSSTMPAASTPPLAQWCSPQEWPLTRLSSAQKPAGGRALPARMPDG
eukprot:CAMPEP_0171086940 /NCGR_PEP_ID=MMETSP0766_2-20121228/19848_1 /TAXON_ID=439317 /ORGANISM="Gambierdiscus australes, Strain CAWD 149" /LENGTH=86 /DNA_ID=CAMNT_0011544613 /DNA_START=412 /DNA_END=672 /DNA_ORIENTATION=+